MIDLKNETVIGLAVAAGMIPPVRDGRKVGVSCLFRWVTDGVLAPDGKARVRLEAAKLGSRWVTSVEALERFMIAQTPKFTDDVATIRTAVKRLSASERAAKELEAAGI